MPDALQYLLDYYKVSIPWNINMVHGANDLKRFKRYLCDPNVHMFEIDIEDNERNITDIVLQHGGVGDVPFIWAIEQLVMHKKALKLDLKNPKGNPYKNEFYKSVFGILHDQWDPKIPLWINADVLNGPNWQNSNYDCLDSKQFIDLYSTYHAINPNTVLSLGYLTGHEPDSPQPYTSRMLGEMRQIVEGAVGLVTIPLRYANLMVEQNVLSGFLTLGSVTIWNREDRISSERFTQLAEYVQSLDVFKDLTGKEGNPIWHCISSSCP